MTAVNQTTATGVFKDGGQAEKALAALRQAGFGESQINVSTEKPKVPPSPAPTTPPPRERSIEAGQLGSMVGGVVGGLLGLAVAAVLPGLELAFGGGGFIAIGAGAILGYFLGGLAGNAIGKRIPRKTSPPGDAGVPRVVVSVGADGRYDEAVDILRRHGALGKGKPLI